MTMKGERVPPVDVLVAFITATAVFAYMPGPSTLYAAARTVAGGAKAGWLASAGIHAGGYVHVFAAAFGLAILFQAIPFLYSALKFLGAGYLIWLGFRMFQSSALSRENQGSREPHSTKKKSHQRAFWDSAVVEILNPKTALFYLAFLPQFTDPSAALPIWAQLLVLGTIVNIMFSSADALCVIFAAKVVATLKSTDRVTPWLHRIGGGALMGLGIHLALSQK